MLRETVAETAFQPESSTAQGSASAVSWGAIIAGGVAAAALTLILLSFGAGVGFSSVSPWSAHTAPATGFHIATGLYFIVTAMLASSVGGYLAGRLRNAWSDVSPREVFFRDTAHGLLAWSLATLLGIGVLGSAAGALAGGAAAGVTRLEGQSSGLLDGYVDALLRADPASTSASGSSSVAGGSLAAGAAGASSPGTSSAGAATAPTDSSATHAETGRLLAAALQTGGDADGLDRTYLAQVVAVRANISQAQAEQRVAAIIARAKSAVDAARKAAAQLSLWLCASLLVGAFAASLAAIEGGGLRDGTWKYKV